MNETANATLALGALPVMAHARGGGGRDGRARRRARLEHRHALAALGRRDAARRGGPRPSEASRSSSTRSAPARPAYRTETAKRILDEVRVTVVRGNAGEIATLVGVAAEVRGVESIDAGGDRGRPRPPGRRRARCSRLRHGAGRSCLRWERGDRDRERPSADGVDHRHRLHVECAHRLLPGCQRRSSARRRGRGPRRVRRRGRARGGRRPRPRVVPRRAVRRARSARPGDARRAGEARMIVHALVGDLETARRAVDAGATVVQLRVKGPTSEIVERGRGFRKLRGRVRRQRRRRRGAGTRRRRCAPRSGRRGSRARLGRQGCCSDAPRRISRRRVATDADYLGVGPVWETPSKDDAAAPIGLDGLAEICAAVDVPVVAIGGIDAANAAACIHAGAAGVAVVRAAADPALRRAVDEALRAR